ncbi:hypothetical protein JZ751_005884 [Albula glossodonta]|uniref:Regulator of G protein signaling 12 n=1 Tax=Albula glossodonta TaxID=121402 RepID=A0A8T2PDY7_9TELE|nr:hypothetical protein JZ751_005884 [Albula glossodonta]
MLICAMPGNMLERESPVLFTDMNLEQVLHAFAGVLRTDVLTSRSVSDMRPFPMTEGANQSLHLRPSQMVGCGSENSLNSNASLPSVQSHRRHTERRVASWAVCFERLLQDPVGEFLKKEFSEENILFWQACEYFSHVPENDKKQLSQRAREIYNSFLSSKATTPVNIDSQAQLADDILNAPRPEMFKEQQLQIFNLMKFDSYSRFLKSSLYQECMLAEVEGRPLPDPYQIPSSPASSKHSVNSDRSNLSTPKKEGKKAKSGKSLNDDYRDEHVDKKKGIFFSWSRNRSFGKGPKKRDIGEFTYDFADSNGRRESQGSLSSGASVELGTSNAGGKNEGDPRNAGPASDKAPRQCNINLPDGSCCSVPIRPGVSIRELLLGLCQKLCINLAAVDLFLPLVLDQDCITLSSRDLRLEKRTLFRLDLVPINRSVGLKAKPTKPVTEVLRPVVAKYGLQLSHLVAKISGEKEPLDLGLPISSLDGLRVVLDVADHTSGKEFFDLISKAQSNRANDQRGLLNKSDLVLPDFLRVAPEPTCSSTPTSRQPGPRRGRQNGAGGAPHRSALNASHHSQSLDSTLDIGPKGVPPSGRRRQALMPPTGQNHDNAPFATPLSPIPHAMDSRKGGVTPVCTVDDENTADLTLVGEGDISSPNCTLLPPSPTALSPLQGSLPEANFTPPTPCHDPDESSVGTQSSSGIPGRSSAPCWICCDLEAASSPSSGSEVRPLRKTTRQLLNSLSRTSTAPRPSYGRRSSAFNTVIYYVLLTGGELDRLSKSLANSSALVLCERLQNEDLFVTLFSLCLIGSEDVISDN